MTASEESADPMYRNAVILWVIAAGLGIPGYLLEVPEVLWLAIPIAAVSIVYGANALYEEYHHV